MTEQLTEQELELELGRKSTDIDRRIQALEQEVSTTGTAIKSRFKDLRREKPLLLLGGTVATGLAIGPLFSGRHKRKRRRSHRKLIDQYVDVLAREVRHAAGKGKEADAAVRLALEDRVPLILYREEQAESKQGFLREVVDLALKTALGFAVKNALDIMASEVNLEERLRVSMGDDGPLDDSAAVTAAVSET